jgi:hypothetical protein
MRYDCLFQHPVFLLYSINLSPTSKAYYPLLDQLHFMFQLLVIADIVRHIENSTLPAHIADELTD